MGPDSRLAGLVQLLVRRTRWERVTLAAILVGSIGMARSSIDFAGPVTSVSRGRPDP
jgi:hypothetical protein